MTVFDDESRTTHDEELELLAAYRAARTEDESLEALRGAGSTAAGLAVVGRYASHSYRPESDLSLLDDDDLTERIRTAAAAREMYAQRGGPEWCIEFCSDAERHLSAELERRKESHGR